MQKKLPEAMTDFKKIIEKNYAFVDKTRFLEVYEESGTSVSMFLRPRRFGKTMFTELLRYYYDIALQEEADLLFKGRYIASHPTSLKNSYYVLQFDLSGVDTRSSESMTRSFIKRVLIGIADFYIRYPKFAPVSLPDDAPESKDELFLSAVSAYYKDLSEFPTPSVIMTDFLFRVKFLIPSRKLMVIIDEYDNFTNDILSRDPGKFRETARKGGELSAFFQALRAGNQDHTIDKIYVTGVLPITMDTTISGFVSENLTSDPQFNEMAGFTDDEVMDLLKQTVDFAKCPFPPEELRAEMKKRYDGYRFAKYAKKTVYNATMCLNFIKELIGNDYQEIPSFKFFANTNIDYDKLYGYFMLIDEQDRKQLIGDLIDRKPVRSNIGMAVKLTSEHETLNYNEGSTILYHLGFLTTMSEEEKKGIPNCSLSDEYLAIPNDYFWKLFARFQMTRVPKVLHEINNIKNLGMMAASNDISILKNMLYRAAGGFTQTDVSREGENQLALTIYTAISVAAGNSFNLTKEYAIKHNGQYVFEDGLAEEEYLDVPEDEPEDQHNDTPENAAQTPDSNESPEEAQARKEIEEFLNSGLTPDASIDTIRGRADLVAINTNTKGPSYIFEFKYKRNTRSLETTKLKVMKTLYERAVKQLNFYVTDDNLRMVPSLHRYVIMFVYGKFLIKEVV
ncbi:AAA family ATPase [Succinimonas sp.]|uniref:AAA family ATPase n=1 Tax=Succinimonas sp. TaxID=1936151 RepID=UPI003864FDED